MTFTHLAVVGFLGGHREHVGALESADLYGVSGDEGSDVSWDTTCIKYHLVFTTIVFDSMKSPQKGKFFTTQKLYIILSIVQEERTSSEDRASGRSKTDSGNTRDTLHRYGGPTILLVN